MNIDDALKKQYGDRIKNNISRIEVIDENGRSYVHNKVKYYIVDKQDEERTLKIFIKPWKNG